MKLKILFPFLVFICLSGHSIAQKAVKEIGHYTQIGLPITALGISIAKGDKKGSIQLLKSFVVETAIVQGLKHTIDRKRPSGGSQSFPSGHTAVSFMSSTYLWKRYGWEYGLPSTVLAAFVGYSRFGIDEPVHYFSDVVAGALIGIGSSWIFTSSYEKDLEVDVTGSMSHIGLRVKVNLN